MATLKTPAPPSGRIRPEFATPCASVFTVNRLSPPKNIAPGPESGAVNVTSAPLTGPERPLRTRTTSLAGCVLSKVELLPCSTDSCNRLLESCAVWALTNDGSIAVKSRSSPTAMTCLPALTPGSSGPDFATFPSSRLMLFGYPDESRLVFRQIAQQSRLLSIVSQPNFG